MNGKLKNPFRGPSPLDTGDPIFGRTREIDTLLAQLVSNRVVLLHSVSGCGKTSLVEAGIRPQLNRFRLHALPTVRFPRRTGETGEGDQSLLQPLRDVLEAAAARRREPLSATAPAFAEESTSEAPQPFDLFIFDQFEEVLDASHVPEYERLEFFKYVGNLLADRSRWALFAMREDYLGALEPYLRYLPNYLESRFRLTQLPIADAQVALVSICQGSGIAFEPAAAERLVGELATSEDVAAPASGRDTRLVEPVYLQVVGRDLWEAARASSIPAITVAHVESAALQGSHTAGQGLAAVDLALQRYYDQAVASAADDEVVDTTGPQPDRSVDSPPLINELHGRIRKWFSDELIAQTPHGELRKQTLVTSTTTVVDADTLRKLENSYIVRKDIRNGTWYELAHDRLVRPVLRSNLAVRRRFQQPWQSDAEAWTQEGEARALLVLRGAALKQAILWAGHNPGRVSPRERKFLDECLAEARFRRRLKWWRRGAYGVGAVTVVLLLSLIWFARAAQRAVVLSEHIAAMNEIKAIESQRAASEAQQRADREQAALKLARTEAEIVREQLPSLLRRLAGLEARLGDSRRQAAVAAEAARQTRDEAERLQAQSEASLAGVQAYVELSKQQLHELGVSNGAYELIEQALGRRGDVPRLEPALAAAEELAAFSSGATGDVAAKRRTEVIGRALQAVHDYFSRGLLVGAPVLPRPVERMAYVDDGDCLRYMSGVGIYGQSLAPAAKCGTGVPATDVPTDFKLATAGALSENGEWAVIASATGSVRLMHHDEVVAQFKPHRHQVTATYLSPTGKYIADATALWTWSVSTVNTSDAREAERKAILHRPRRGPGGWLRWLTIFMGSTTKTINGFAIHEDPRGDNGPLIAVALQDGSIEYHDLRRKERLFTIPGPLRRPSGGPGHVRPVTQVTFDGAGGRLASGGDDGRVLVWEVPDKRAQWREKAGARGYMPLAELGRQAEGVVVAPACIGRVTALRFSPDERLLVVGCAEGTVRLYDTRAMGPRVTPVEVLEARVGEVRGVAFHPARREMVVAGTDLRVEQWRVPTQQELAQRWEVKASLRRLISDGAQQVTYDSKAVTTLIGRVRELMSLGPGGWTESREEPPSVSGP